MTNPTEEKRKLDEVVKKQKVEQVARDRKAVDEQIMNRRQELKNLTNQVAEAGRMLGTLKLQLKTQEQEETKLKTEVQAKEREIKDLERKRDSIR